MEGVKKMRDRALTEKVQWLEQPEIKKRAAMPYQELKELGEAFYSKALTYISEKDYTNAYQYLEEAAGCGCAAAISQMARCAYEGWFSEPDLPKAVCLLRQAVCMSEPWATVQLAKLYLEGGWGLPVNTGLAKELASHSITDLKYNEKECRKIIAQANELQDVRKFSAQHAPDPSVTNQEGFYQKVLLNSPLYFCPGLDSELFRNLPSCPDIAGEYAEDSTRFDEFLQNLDPKELPLRVPLSQEKMKDAHAVTKEKIDRDRTDYHNDVFILVVSLIVTVALFILPAIPGFFHDIATREFFGFYWTNKFRFFAALWTLTVIIKTSGSHGDLKKNNQDLAQQTYNYRRFGIDFLYTELCNYPSKRLDVIQERGAKPDTRHFYHRTTVSDAFEKEWADLKYYSDCGCQNLRIDEESGNI